MRIKACRLLFIKIFLIKPMLLLGRLNPKGIGCSYAHIII